MSVEDAYFCFGSSSSSDDDSTKCSTDSATFKTDEELKNFEGNKLRESNNHRRLVADKMRHGLPICSPDFEVFPTANGRGLGLRALRNYAVGDEIMREHAVLRVPNQQAASTREEAQEKHAIAVQQAFDLLSSETQAAVLNLSNNCSQDHTAEEVGVYETNSFLLESSGNAAQYDQDYGGLFLTVARINHSCCPNAQHFWRHDLQKTIIHAVQEIEMGDEILICYGPADCQITADRRSYLEERLSFACNCRMCVEGNNFAGDDRMKELSRLLHDIRDQLPLLGNGGKKIDTDAKAIIDSVERCVELLSLQNLDAASGTMKAVLRYGYQAASAWTSTGNRELERSYLDKLLEVVGTGEGLGSPNYHEVEHMLRDIEARG